MNPFVLFGVDPEKEMLFELRDSFYGYCCLCHPERNQTVNQQERDLRQKEMLMLWRAYQFCLNWNVARQLTQLHSSATHPFFSKERRIEHEFSIFSRNCKWTSVPPFIWIHHLLFPESKIKEDLKKGTVSNVSPNDIIPSWMVHCETL